MPRSVGTEQHCTPFGSHLRRHLHQPQTKSKGQIMGKASRMKKQRKEQCSSSATGGIGPFRRSQEVRSPAKLGADIQELIANLGGGNVLVMDEHGIPLADEETRLRYWMDVCDGICNRGASCLPELARRGRLIHLSILDVKIPVMRQGIGEQTLDDILTATFLLGHLDCFQWLLGEARRTNTHWNLVGQVFKAIVQSSGRLSGETPQMVMAKMMVRFMAKTFHEEGVLGEAMDDRSKVMAQPFARRIAQDYLEEVAAAKERVELEAEVTREERAVESSGLRI